MAGDESNAHFNLAQIYFRKGLYKQAKEHYAKALALNPSSTLARTGVEAAGALASVFQPVQPKATADALVAPEVTAKIQIPLSEAGNPVRSEPRESNPETVSVDLLKTAEADFPPAIRNQPAPAPALRKIRERGELKEVSAAGFEKGTEVKKTADATLSAPLPYSVPPPQAPASREENGRSFHVRVASFSSYKIALRELGDVQRSGVPANLTSWTDRKGKQWHTLTAGPWTTREEALGCKTWLEQGGRFKAVVQQEPLKGTRKTLSARNGNGTPKTFAQEREPGVEISNGNGVNGMAARVRTYLKQKGLNVVRLTNADNFAHSKTSIFYQKGFNSAASEVAENLPGVERMEEVKELDRPSVNIRVVIGKELLSHSKLFKGGPRS